MKRLILTLFVGLLCFTYQAKAQWTVIDPSNLVQKTLKSFSILYVEKEEVVIVCFILQKDTE